MIDGWRPMTAPASRALLPLCLLPLCLLFGAAASVLLGPDGNWDLLAYHLQNGAALLHGRFWQDLLPAGMQSNLNPVLDASYAALALGPLRHHPRLLAATMGLWFGGAIYFTTRIGQLLYGPKSLPIAAGVLLGITGMAVLPQIGTTSDEIQVAALMLAGLLLLLRTPGPGAFMLGGALFGLAAGLKLTATAFAPAAALAAISLDRRPRAMAATIALFGTGWLCGLLLADGWWAWQLWQRFGSPVFPMFNGIFRSPWYPPASVVDDRFFPRNWAQWLAYPLFWTEPSGPHTSELPFTDLRPAATYLLALACALAIAARRRIPAWRAPHLTPPQRAALLFLAAGYITWLLTSSILRYAVILEIVAALLLPLLLAQLLRGPAQTGALAALVVLLLATTRYGPLARRPYGPETLRADMGWVAPDTLLVVTFRGPSAHALAFLPQHEGIQALQLGTSVLEARGWPLHDEAMRMVRDHAGPLKVLTEGDPAGRLPELAELGLSPELTNCRPIDSTLTPTSPLGLHACDATRQQPIPLTAPFWAEAATHYRTLVQPSTPADDMIATAYLQSAGPAARGTRFLDWADLLWGGLVRDRAALPATLDPNTLYVATPAYAAALASRIDPARDMLGQADGWIIAAPGWRTCATCTATLPPITSRLSPLQQGSPRPVMAAALRTACSETAGGWMATPPSGRAQPRPCACPSPPTSGPVQPCGCKASRSPHPDCQRSTSSRPSPARSWQRRPCAAAAPYRSRSRPPNSYPSPTARSPSSSSSPAPTPPAPPPSASAPIPGCSASR